MPDIELQRLVAVQELPTYLFPQFPFNTQRVEKGDKLETEASTAVCCVNSLGGFIHTQINTHYELSKFFSERGYFIYRKYSN